VLCWASHPAVSLCQVHRPHGAALVRECGFGCVAVEKPVHGQAAPIRPSSWYR
jgi:hypothetical protein